MPPGRRTSVMRATLPQDFFNSLLNYLQGKLPLHRFYFTKSAHTDDGCQYFRINYGTEEGSIFASPSKEPYFLKVEKKEWVTSPAECAASISKAICDYKLVIGAPDLRLTGAQIIETISAISTSEDVDEDIETKVEHALAQLALLELDYSKGVPSKYFIEKSQYALLKKFVETDRLLSNIQMYNLKDKTYPHAFLPQPFAEVLYHTTGHSTQGSSKTIYRSFSAAILESIKLKVKSITGKSLNLPERIEKYLKREHTCKNCEMLTLGFIDDLFQKAVNLFEKVSDLYYADRKMLILSEKINTVRYSDRKKSKEEAELLKKDLGTLEDRMEAIISALQAFQMQVIALISDHQTPDKEDSMLSGASGMSTLSLASDISDAVSTLLKSVNDFKAKTKPPTAIFTRTPGRATVSAFHQPPPAASSSGGASGTSTSVSRPTGK